MSHSDEPGPPVLESLGFQLTGDDFSVAGVGRDAGDRLKALYHPAALRLKRDQKEAEEAARRLFRKPFFFAQLKHYGIPFNQSGTVHDLRNRLQLAVETGQCREIPESILQLENYMRQEYEPRKQKWQADLSDYRRQKEREQEESFHQCSTPSERANYSLDRFLDFYFFTNGHFDPNKTQRALALPGLRNRRELHERVNQIQGLYTESGGLEPDRTLCIGCSPVAVSSLASVMNRQAGEQQEQRQLDVWDRFFARHREYVSQLQSNNACMGSYYIKCDKGAGGWLIDQPLTLDIHLRRNGDLTAAYDFGTVEGTMILSRSEEKLTAMADPDEYLDNNLDSGEDDSGDSAEDDEDEDEDGEDGKGKGRRKRLAEDVTAAIRRNEQPNGSTAKKRKLMPSLCRRFYYRLWGHYTGEGELLADHPPGHIDFLDNQCASFAGLAYDFPGVRSYVGFVGYKVSDKPRVKPERVDAYSGAHSYGRARMWM